MNNNNHEDAILTRFLAVRGHLDERGRRVFVAAEALAIPADGVAIVSRATGVARSTISRGILDLQDPTRLTGAVRRAGAGRPTITKSDPSVLQDLATLVEPATVGDPMRPLLWVSKSLVKLAAALVEQGHKISANTVSTLLEKLGFRRQVNQKTREGANHPDRDAQFEHINAQTSDFAEREQPAISVDTKKKELVGDFKNAGSDYRPTGCPTPVRTHDFMDKELGKAIPYGVYDVCANAGWVSVGIDHDTATFAVHSIGVWWQKMGYVRYPTATALLIMADGGGSNGSRVRLWKYELQKFADASGLSITVCHYPPGTSKWNKIEHRLFCFISQNWRGKPLESLVSIIELIGATATSTGLTVRCELDSNLYEKGVKISEEEFASINIERDVFHPEWNYTIHPRVPLSLANEAVISA